MSMISSRGPGLLKGRTALSPRMLGPGSPGGLITPAAGFPAFPPALATLVHWYDFNDLTTLWQDTAGTIAVTTPGDDLARADDKGTQPESVIQATAFNRPFWGSTGGTGEYDSQASSSKYLSVIATLGLGGGDRTCAFVANRDSLGSGTASPFGWQSFSGVSVNMSAAGFLVFFSNAALVSSAAALPFDTLLGGIMVHRSASPNMVGYNSVESGSTTTLLNGTFTNPDGSDNLTIGGAADASQAWRGTIKEVLIWSAELTAQEILDFKAYTEGKHGLTWA